MQPENLKIERLQRVSVIGTSCSGKSTFARKLASILNTEHIEIDAFNFLSDWVQRPRDEFMDLVEQAAERDRWVFDGNYTRTQETVWGRATAIVWLNYSFSRTLYRSVKRTTSRVYTGEPLWAGNRETFKTSFMSRDSILLWVLTTYHAKRRRYTQLLSQNKLKDKDIFIFRHPAQADNFLRRIEQLCK